MYIYTLVPTSMGWVSIIASENGIMRLGLPRETREAALSIISSLHRAHRDDRFLEKLAGKIKDYFAGNKVIFDEKLDLAGFSPFYLDVWRLTREVPYGYTASYSEIARQACKPRACRAVGQALGHNPVPVIVPCHRIIRSDGSLGGFSGGLNIKSRLLEIERTETVGKSNRGTHIIEPY